LRRPREVEDAGTGEAGMGGAEAPILMTCAARLNDSLDSDDGSDDDEEEEEEEVDEAEGDAPTGSATGKGGGAVLGGRMCKEKEEGSGSPDRVVSNGM